MGKVGIPDHVLNKPGALTDEERAWIQEHPIVGTDIVGRAPSLHEALKVIRQHHERYDGGGYPDGLAGDEISLAARIVGRGRRLGRAHLRPRLPAGLAARPRPPPPRGRPRHPLRDPQCLDAFLALMAERGHRPDDVVPAEDACHEQATTPPRPARGRW
jgi:hypothetical protein